MTAKKSGFKFERSQKNSVSVSIGIARGATVSKWFGRDWLPQRAARRAICNFPIADRPDIIAPGISTFAWANSLVVGLCGRAMNLLTSQ